MKNVNLVWAVALLLIIASCGRPSASEEAKKVENVETVASEEATATQARKMAMEAEKVAMEAEKNKAKTIEDLIALIGQDHDLTDLHKARIEKICTEYGFENLSAADQLNYIEKITYRALNEE